MRSRVLAALFAAVAGFIVATAVSAAMTNPTHPATHSVVIADPEIILDPIL